MTQFHFAGAIRGNYGARLPATVHRLQLPEGLCLVDRNARFHVPVPVQRILPIHIQGKTRASKYQRAPRINLICANERLS